VRKEIKIPVSWGTLKAQVQGKPSAKRTFVAIHGWLDNSNSFLPMIQQWPDDSRWICIDMAGHGKSDWRPAGFCYHFFDYIQDLVDVFQSLKLEQVHLVGHSLGAGVAAFFAGSFPDRTLSLACLDSLGPLPFASASLPQHYREFRKEWEHYLSRAKVKRLIPSVSRAVAARRMAGTLLPESAELLVKRNLKKQSKVWVWGTDPRLRLPTAYRVSEDQVRAFLAAIQAPTLIVEASRGVIAAGAYRKERLALLKNMYRKTVEGDHHVHMDHPERIIPILNQFYAAHA
jgi:pimeloyl-ACP methyl ester carboxylesterase